jgi:hypothetical protein
VVVEEAPDVVPRRVHRRVDHEPGEVHGAARRARLHHGAVEVERDEGGGGYFGEEETEGVDEERPARLGATRARGDVVVDLIVSGE